MIHLKRTSPDDPDFACLIALLDEDLWKRYAEAQQFFSTFNKMKLDAKVVVAYDEGEPAGCGCFRVTEDEHTVEMKRMYVMENRRGKGIATSILNELQDWAKQMGKQRAILETGNKQPEAISLYKKLGYQQIDRYEPYVNSEQSICMGKNLV